MNTPKLERCKHCGGEAEYCTGNHYISICHYIRCKQCHMQTMAVDEGRYLQFSGEKDVVFTAESAKQWVIDVWNRRTSLPDNKALTVEELWEMLGQPVYMVPSDAEPLKQRGWCIVGEYYDSSIALYFPENTFYECGIKRGSILAYRRPPEKGE